MSLFRTLLFSAMFMVLLPPSGGFCEEKSLTLTEAIRIALEENYDLRAEKNSLLASKENVGIARSYFLPKLTFEEKATRTNNPPQAFMMKLNQQRFSSSDFDITSLNNPHPINDYQTSFMVEQPVFFMKSFVGFSMAKKEYAAKNSDFERKKEETVLRVVQAYLRVQTARAYLRVAQDGIEDSQEHLRIAEIRYKNGLGLYSDLLRAQTALAAAQQALVSSEKEYTVAKRWFGLVLSATEPVNTADEEISLSVKDIDYYQEVSLARKDVAAMKIRSDNARENVKFVESSYLPYIGIGGSYQMNDYKNAFGSEGDSWLLSAFLRWDLFDGTLREFERSKAQYQAIEMKEHLKGLKEFISFKVNEAYLAVEEAKQNVELAHAALKTAEEGKRLVSARYENSLSPIVDLLEVQLNLNQARANAARHENDYKLAVMNLGYESGTLLKDLNVE